MMVGVAAGVGEGLAAAFPPEVPGANFSFTGPPVFVFKIFGLAVFASVVVEGVGVSELACDCKDE